MVQLDNISLSFGGQKIFDSISWFIRESGRVGLVGPNGAGKTTLLRLLSGSVTPDAGTVSFRARTSIGYLQQEVLEEGTSGESVIDHVVGSFEDVASAVDEEQDILVQLEDPGLDESRRNRLLVQLDKVHSKIESLDVHRLPYRAESVLTGLGFSPADLERDVASFSGGWRMRMSLATLLLKQPDLLLLDEPTNHLDIETIDWLEQYLSDYSGAVILVSHDRYFLDRMVTTTVELSQATLTEYVGNYTGYLEEREKRLVLQRAAFENQQREIRQAELFIRRFRAKNTKARQVQSRIKMLEKLERIPEPVPDTTSIRFKFPEPEKPGRLVLQLSEFSKSYPVENGEPVQVFDRAPALTIERGDRIALVGKNGAGKSTLARILKGTESLEGERKLGLRVKVGFFAQSQADEIDSSSSVLDVMRRTAYGWTETSVRSLLGAFLFSADDVDKPVYVLSGGEKSRLALALTLVTPANLLVLDEPTNHLDIRSRDALTQALRLFPGTFVVVSHDRHFVDAIAKKVWYVADGSVREYHGTYSGIRLPEYVVNEVTASTSSTTKPAGVRVRARASKGPKTREQKRQEAEQRNRLARARKKLRRMIKSASPINLKEIPTDLLPAALQLVEEEITKLETERSELETLLADPGFYDDEERSGQAISSFKNVEQSITRMLGVWESLSHEVESLREHA